MILFATNNSNTNQRMEYKQNISSTTIDDVSKVLNIYDQIIRIDPIPVEAYNNKANLLYKLGKYEEAVKSYDEARKINPVFTPLWDQYAREIPKKLSSLLHISSDLDKIKDGEATANIVISEKDGSGMILNIDFGQQSVIVTVHVQNNNVKMDPLSWDKDLFSRMSEAYRNYTLRFIELKEGEQQKHRFKELLNQTNS